jgi:YVTN family beta-propeller protein
MSHMKRILRHSGVVAAILTSIGCVAAAGATAAPLAFTANYEGDSVSVINTGTNTVVGEPIPVGDGPYSVAVTPDGRRAYVANVREDTVDVIDTATLKVIGKPIEVGKKPSTIAISPDGRTAYVTDEESDEVSVINLQNNSVTSVTGIKGPYGVAVAPSGEAVYVTSIEDGTVSVIDPKTLQVVGPPIVVGEEPYVVTFTPNGKTAYVSDYGTNEVSAIDTATRNVVPIEVGEAPWGLGMTPDGSKLFVANYSEKTVSVINTATGVVIGEIPVGEEPYEFGMAPNGKVAYLAEYRSEDVLAIDTQTDKLIGEPIQIAGGPWQVVVAPDQSPQAAFTAPDATATFPATFSGAASTDPDGSVVSWNWAFGDGGTATGVSPSHTYAAPGSYGAKLSVVDNEGCGEAEVFTGRTAYCSGGESSVTHPVGVAAAPITKAPSNKFTFGRLVHNRKNGTARLQVKLPAAGSIVLAGPKVHMVRKKIGAAGSLWLTIHARVKLNKQLKKTLRAKVGFRVTFTPTGGTPKTTGRSITLQRVPRK